MNRKQEDLPDLIIGMSASEKRHFRLLSETFIRQGNKPLYLKLFENIETGSFEHSGFQSAMVLAKTRQRLYGNLLKSLRLYHEGMSVDMDIQNNLSEIEILYKRGLPKKAIELVNKSIRLASEYERFGLTFPLLKWEKQINIVLDNPSRTVVEIMTAERINLDKLSQINFLESIYGKIMVLKRQYGYAQGDAKTRLEAETIFAEGMPAYDQCLSNEARFYHNFIYSVYYWMTYNHKKAFATSSGLLNPGKNTILPSIHISAFLQHITSSVCIGDFATSLKCIELSESYISEYGLNQSSNYNTQMFAYHATYKMIIYNYTGARAKLGDTIRITEEGLKTFGKSLTYELKQIINGNLLNSYMGLGDMKTADQIWNSMFNRNSKNIRRDIFADLYCFRLFSLLQSKTYVAIPSAAISASRYYLKFPDAKEVFQVELPIALLLKRKTAYENPVELHKVLYSIKEIVSGFISRLNGAKNFQEQYTRFEIWIDALITGKPFYEVAEKWYSTFRK